MMKTQYKVYAIIFALLSLCEVYGVYQGKMWCLAAFALLAALSAFFYSLSQPKQHQHKAWVPGPTSRGMRSYPSSFHRHRFS